MIEYSLRMRLRAARSRAPQTRLRIMHLYFLIALCTAAKFWCVDFAVAEILNWPIFGLSATSFHALRSALRASAVLLPSLASTAFALLFAFLAKEKQRAAALLVLDFLLTLLVVTDRLYIRYYTDVFIFKDIILIPQTGAIAKSIWSLLKISDFLLFADIPAILYLLKRKKIIIEPSINRLGAALLALVLISVQAGTLFHLKKERPAILNAMYDRMSVCAWTSTATFHWYDALSLCSKFFAPVHKDTKTADEIYKWFEAHHKQEGTTSHIDTHTSVPRTAPKNLILVQCEALQYFVINLKVNGAEVTPNFNKFARESIYFPNTWSQVAGGNSADAEFMANTGLFPSPIGAAYTLYDRNTYNSLADAMRKKYAESGNDKSGNADCFVVQGTTSGFWNCSRMYGRLKFHRQYSQNTYPNDERIGLGLSDRAIFSRASEIISRTDKPFYAFIVTLTSHHPFDFDGIPRNTLNLPPQLKNTLIGNYLLSVHYLDAQFGRFIENLRKNNKLDKCLIAVYGDHPAIPIANRKELEAIIGHKTETASAWKKTRRVPLMIRACDIAPRIDERNVGQMDILPTVASLMGLDIKTYFGHNLTKPDNGLVIFRNGSYISGDVFVEPAAKHAVNLTTEQEAAYALFSRDTEAVQKQLKYNDLILEKDLLQF